MRALPLSALVVVCVMAAGIAHAGQSETTVFPPKTLGNSSCPAGETTVLAWSNGAPTTYCLNSGEVRDLAVPDLNSAQIILERALPNCSTGDRIVKTESGFSCQNPLSYPTCTDTQYLWSDGTALSCREFETKVCTPNWVTTGYGNCSATCGGGVQDVFQSDGCSHTRTLSQACNTQSCGPTCTPGSQTYTTPGTFAFNVPRGYKTITTEVWGGGQAPYIWSLFDYGGNSGGTSTFNGTLRATGGNNSLLDSVLNHLTAVGVGSGGDINLSGSIAGLVNLGLSSQGANAPNGGLGGLAQGNADLSGQQPGAGGANRGCVWGVVACLGGASGGYAQKTYTAGTLAPGDSIPVTVGGGGIPTWGSYNYYTTSPGNWGKGGDGMVRIQWTCP